jgi:DNA-binding response OmpR family regulator
MKLLIVDDDEFLRDMYITKFQAHGHEVVGAGSSAAALTELDRSGPFDCILLDMIMPGMGGVELIRTISSRQQGEVPKCIVLSNQGQEDDVAEATKAGAIGYIIKAHMIPSEVVARVEKLLTKA